MVATIASVLLRSVWDRDHSAIHVAIQSNYCRALDGATRRHTRWDANDRYSATRTDLLPQAVTATQVEMVWLLQFVIP